MRSSLTSRPDRRASRDCLTSNLPGHSPGILLCKTAVYPARGRGKCNGRASHSRPIADLGKRTDRLCKVVVCPVRGEEEQKLRSIVGPSGGKKERRALLGRRWSGRWRCCARWLPTWENEGQRGKAVSPPCLTADKTPHRRRFPPVGQRGTHLSLLAPAAGNNMAK